MQFFSFSSHVQSTLSAVSTVVANIPVIDSVEELIESDFQVYGLAHYKELLGDDEIRNRYQTLISELEEWLNRIFKNEHARNMQPAYTPKFSQNYMFMRIKRFIYLKMILQQDIGYIFWQRTRNSRINSIECYSGWWKGGFFRLSENREKYYYQKNLDRNDSGKKLSVDDLIVIFYILGFGFLLSFLIFSAEITFDKMKHLRLIKNIIKLN